MPHLLDTNVLRYYLDGVGHAVQLVNSLIPDGVGLSVITYIELYQGTLQTSDPAWHRTVSRRSSRLCRCCP